MEIKLVINKANKRKVLALLDQLVEAEGASGKENQSTKASLVPAETPSLAMGSLDPLDLSYRSEEVPLSEPSVAVRPFGAWAMFNSFLPGKATLRVLGHILAEKKTDFVPFGDLIELASESFRLRDLAPLRGFPGSKKASSVPRFATHLVLPLAEMGILSIQTRDGIQQVGITKSGLEFSLFENEVLDRRAREEKLSEAERQWLLTYLQAVDKQGFKEYTTLASIAAYIRAESPEQKQLVQWLATRPDFREHVKSTSRYSHQQSKFNRQLYNIANTYTSSKVALLRELDILDNVRGQYKVMSEMWGC